MRIFDFLKKKNKNFDLETVLKMDDETSMIIAIGDMINELSNYGEDLSALTEPQKNFLFVENVEREVNNGGFSQFYRNSSGDFSHESEQALRTIEAHQMADIMANANAVWPDKKVPEGQTQREVILDKIEDQAEPVWEKCDQAFYRYPDNIAVLLIEYVKKHKKDFA